MDSSTLDQYKQMLYGERKRLIEILHSMEVNEEGEQNRYTFGELSNYDNHPADIGTELFELEFNKALRVNVEYNLQEVNKALDKVKAGTYGKCEICGKDIGNERLDAMPFTRHCMECEEKYHVDVITSTQGRPVEELVLDSPFGQKYLYKRNDDEHEGIDYLNDLMKYGSSNTPADQDHFEIDNYENFYNNEIDNQGAVDKMDLISNEAYKKQLPKAPDHYYDHVIDDYTTDK